ncbi:HIT family protein [Streptococcus caprae]|uniref:HIT family protein n=1 Tax=Streptococcus caprae TaxID=1640501 RepID=A0ABV8CXT4_9STRE
MTCVFCKLVKEKSIAQSKCFYAIWDIDPIQEGHLLVIAKSHRMSIAELSSEERLDLLDFQEKLISCMEKQASVLGVTVVVNNGNVMDQDLHFHSHLLPRYVEDGFWDRVQPAQKIFPKEQFEADLQ